MSEAIGGSVTAAAGGVGGVDLGSTDNLQYKFAILQLGLANIAKNGAAKYMDKIENARSEQTQLTARLREAKGKQTGTAEKSAMSAELKEYMDNNGLSRPTPDAGGLFTKDDWEAIAKTLEIRQNAVQAGNQQDMIFVQEFMGQFNSLLQGANSAIQSLNQSLQELARTR